ncbi:hypothetical protein DW069_25395 [Bacteroides thetaiotaomicron]|nr:hypothetical protein DW069_25395 [Bacteroides thetaiotaomicron]
MRLLYYSTPSFADCDFPLIKEYYEMLYYSTPSFADCDFPLIKEYMEKGLDVLYLIKTDSI